jgi:hypothetical protein
MISLKGVEEWSGDLVNETLIEFLFPNHGARL